MEGRADKLKDQLERQDSELRNQLGNTQAGFQAKLDTQVQQGLGSEMACVRASSFGGCKPFANECQTGRS